MSSSKPLPIDAENMTKGDNEKVRVQRKTLLAVLEQCQRALELLAKDYDEDDNDEGADSEEEPSREGSWSSRADPEADELCNLLKSRVECPDFLQKLERAQVSQINAVAVAEEGSSWEMVSSNDTWDSENADLDEEDYVLVGEEDILDGIACFMATYLLSLKQTKNMTPSQLQEALGKTFSVKKKKGKLRKAWDGSKVLYNVASWGATAIGIYQNPVLLRVASKAFWTSCHAISKLL